MLSSSPRPVLGVLFTRNLSRVFVIVFIDGFHCVPYQPWVSPRVLSERSRKDSGQVSHIVSRISPEVARFVLPSFELFIVLYWGLSGMAVTIFQTFYFQLPCQSV